MSAGFLVWRGGEKKDGICKLKGIEGVNDTFEISEGVSRLEGWSPDASAAMSPKFPKDIGLADALPGMFLFISAKVKEFLEGESVGRIEFLPIKIINHKDRSASDAYFVANPLDIVDCIDSDASVVEINDIDNSFMGCEQLVLKEDAISPELKMFRLGNWMDVVVVRRDLAERMKAAGLTGLRFVEPAKYTGLT